MSASPRHELDEAIDRVAARMVATEDDAGVMHRVMARLPERAATPWFLSMRAQVATAAAIVVVAFLYSRPSPEYATRPDPAAKPVAEGREPVAPAAVQAARSVPVAVRRLPTPTSAKATVGRPDSRLPAASPGDHERSLPPVDRIQALELTEIAPSAIELDVQALLEPLALAELVLDTKGDR